MMIGPLPLAIFLNRALVFALVGAVEGRKRVGRSTDEDHAEHADHRDRDDDAESEADHVDGPSRNTAVMR